MRFLSAVEASAWNSKNSSAFSGRRIALMPNPMKIVAKMLAAMRREDDWEGAILCGYDLKLVRSVICSSVSRKLSLHTSCYVSLRVEYVVRGCCNSWLISVENGLFGYLWSRRESRQTRLAAQLIAVRYLDLSDAGDQDP